MKKYLTFLSVILLFAGLVGTTFAQTTSTNLQPILGYVPCYPETTPWFEYNIQLPDSAYINPCCGLSGSESEALKFTHDPTPGSEYVFYYKDYTDSTEAIIPDWMTNLMLYADLKMITDSPSNSFQIWIRHKGEMYYSGSYGFIDGQSMEQDDTTTIYFHNWKNLNGNDPLPVITHIDSLFIYQDGGNSDTISHICDQIRFHSQKDSCVLDYMGGDDLVSHISPFYKGIPESFILNQNYPNPFNPATNIVFSINKADFVNLTVYNILGQTVATLVDEKLSIGSYNYSFDGQNLSSGTYFYKLTTQSGYSQVKKMILIK